MRRLIAALCVSVLALGCGREPYRLAPVAGTVAMDGKPLPNVHVSFVPLGTAENSNPGPGSRALTNAQGQFNLTTTTGRLGAVVGKHRVSIEAEQPAAASAAGEQSDGAESREAMLKRIQASLEAIPAKYNRESMLTFDVPPEGVKDAHFELNK
jgi:hypothetical protein